MHKRKLLNSTGHTFCSLLFRWICSFSPPVCAKFQWQRERVCNKQWTYFTRNWSSLVQWSRAASGWTVRRIMQLATLAVNTNSWKLELYLEPGFIPPLFYCTPYFVEVKSGLAVQDQTGNCRPLSMCEWTPRPTHGQYSSLQQSGMYVSKAIKENSDDDNINTDRYCVNLLHLFKASLPADRYLARTEPLPKCASWQCVNGWISGLI